MHRQRGTACIRHKDNAGLPSGGHHCIPSPQVLWHHGKVSAKKGKEKKRRKHTFVVCIHRVCVVCQQVEKCLVVWYMPKSCDPSSCSTSHVQLPTFKCSTFNIQHSTFKLSSSTLFNIQQPQYDLSAPHANVSLPACPTRCFMMFSFPNALASVPLPMSTRPVPHE
jgi:hypothetical protein